MNIIRAWSLKIPTEPPMLVCVLGGLFGLSTVCLGIAGVIYILYGR